MKIILKIRFGMIGVLALLSVLATFRFYVVKQYCSLCLSAGFETVAAAPQYFLDTAVSLMPALF